MEKQYITTSSCQIESSLPSLDQAWAWLLAWQALMSAAIFLRSSTESSSAMRGWFLHEETEASSSISSSCMSSKSSSKVEYRWVIIQQISDSSPISSSESLSLERATVASKQEKVLYLHDKQQMSYWEVMVGRQTGNPLTEPVWAFTMIRSNISDTWQWEYWK